MDPQHVWSALERGGAAVQGNPASAESPADPRLAKYNGLLDPPGAEALGSALAEHLGGREIDLVVVWEEVEDVVLGFVIAQRLSVPVLRTFNADGLVGHAGQVPRGARAVLVTDCLRTPHAMRAVKALLENVGGELLGVAALVESGAEEEPPLACLVALRDQFGAGLASRERGA
jgi:adenine/guanine phosphoribosyltransferase-like PRPP-binding protein